MRYLEGNLIQLAEAGGYNVVMHGCNCKNTMGSGVALDIATAWPEARAADDATPRADRDKLGAFSSALIRRPPATFRVYNLYTQYHYGPRFQQHFELDALEACLKRFVDTWEGEPAAILAPMIGTGAGGGRWRKIEPLMIDYLDNYHHLTIVKYVP